MPDIYQKIKCTQGILNINNKAFETSMRTTKRGFQELQNAWNTRGNYVSLFTAAMTKDEPMRQSKTTNENLAHKRKLALDAFEIFQLGIDSSIENLQIELKIQI